MPQTRCKKKVKNTELLGKYSDEQARDDHGRWTSEGGAASAATESKQGWDGSGLPPTVRNPNAAVWDNKPVPASGDPSGWGTPPAATPTPKQLGGGVEPPVNWSNYEHSSSDPNNPHLPFKNPDGSPAAPFSAGYNDPSVREAHLLAPVAGESDAANLESGISETRLLELQDGTPVIFKPSSGEAGGIHDNISDGYSVERETGAWQVAKIVGMDDMVAASVPREIDGESGVMIEFQNGNVAAGVPDGGATITKFDGDKGLARAAAFDYVTGNEDRHGANWIVTDKGDLKLIDHNLTFPDEGEWDRRGNARFIEQAAYKFDSEETSFTPKGMAKPYVDNEAKIVKALEGVGLPHGSIAGVKERIHILSDTETWDRL